MEAFIWAALPLPTPKKPFPFPTATTALNLVSSPASVCFCTMPTLTTSDFRSGMSVLTISGSLNLRPIWNISSREVIFPSWTILPSLVLGTHGGSSRLLAPPSFSAALLGHLVAGPHYRVLGVGIILSVVLGLEAEP